MKRLLVGSTMALTALTFSAGVEAKGCIRGAIVGGIAGHAVGHGVVGAVGGCIAGRHLANRPVRQDVQPAQQPLPGRSY